MLFSYPIIVQNPFYALSAVELRLLPIWIDPLCIFHHAHQRTHTFGFSDLYRTFEKCGAKKTQGCLGPISLYRAIVTLEMGLAVAPRYHK